MTILTTSQKKIHTAVSHYWHRAIIDLVYSNIDRVYYIGLTGSILTENFSATSDIDVLVLYDPPELTYNCLYLDCSICDNHQLELHVSTYFRYLQKLDYASHTGISYLLVSTRDLIPLCDKYKIHETLIERSMDLLQSGPNVLSVAEKSHYRRTLCDMINNLNQSNDGVEMEFNRIQLYVLLIELTLIIERQWRSGSQWRWTYRALERSGSDRCLLLKEIISSGCSDAIIAYALSTLQEIGGPPENNFRLQL